jgi:hypothetical protein
MVPKLSSSSSMALQSLKEPCPPHIGGFFNLFRHLVGFPWTDNQPIATMASTYKGQHNTERQKQISTP